MAAFFKMADIIFVLHGNYVNLKQVIPIGANWHLYLSWKRPFWSQNAKIGFAVSSLQIYLNFLINFTSVTNGNDISVCLHYLSIQTNW